MDPNDFGDKIEAAYSRISSATRKAVNISLVITIPLFSGCSFYTQIRPPYEERSEERVAVVKDSNKATSIESIIEEHNSAPRPQMIERYGRSYGYSYFEDDYLTPRVGDFDSYIYHGGYDSRYSPYNYSYIPWGYGYPMQYGYYPFNYGYDPYYRGSNGALIPPGYELIRSDELGRLYDLSKPKKELTPEQAKAEQEKQRKVWDKRVNPYNRPAPVVTPNPQPNTQPQYQQPVQGSGQQTQQQQPSANKTPSGSKSSDDKESAAPKKTRR